MRLAVAHPEVAAVPCEDCQKHLYNDRWKLQHDARKIPLQRTAATPTPCWNCPKIPKGEESKPENAVTMNEANRALLHYYFEVQAGAKMDDDLATRFLCGCLHQIIREMEARRSDWRPMLGALMAGLKK